MPSQFTKLFQRIGAVILMVNVFIVVYFVSAPHDHLNASPKSVSFTEDHHNKIEDHHDRILAIEKQLAQREDEKTIQLEREHNKEWEHFVKAKPKQLRPLLSENSKAPDHSKNNTQVDENVIVQDGTLVDPLDVEADHKHQSLQYSTGNELEKNKPSAAYREPPATSSSPVRNIKKVATSPLPSRNDRVDSKRRQKVVDSSVSLYNADDAIVRVPKKKKKKKMFLKSDALALQDPNYFGGKPRRIYSKKDKLILIYTQLHGHDEWYNLHFDDLLGFTKRSGCNVTACEITYDKSDLPSAAAVIFHDRDLPSPDALYSLSKTQRPAGQRWVFFTSETPKNTEHSLLPYNNLFNWTMTYKLASDIVVPYLQYRTLDTDDPRPPKKNYAEGKRRKVAWLVGNCHFGLRMEVVQVLQAFTDVYVGGACRDTFKRSMNCTRWCPESELSNYKFFLALENGVCTDYITEKYWKYIEKDLVPIVMGGADYANPLLAIPGSFINIADYDSLEELGKYINMLDKDDKAYNAYFDWKQYYKVWHPPIGDWPFESYWVCKLCEMLHDKTLPDKIYDKLSDFWDEQTDCELPERRLKNKLFPKDYDWEHESEEEKQRLKKAEIPLEFDELQ